jgi:hypothetical protein
MTKNLVPTARQNGAPPGVEPPSDAGSFKRHAPTRAEVKYFDRVQTNLLASYMAIGSVASSESVMYHIVDNDDFPFAATDGVAVYLNRNSKPAPDSPNPKGGFFSLPPAEGVFVLTHEIVHILREDALNGHVVRTQGFVRLPPKVATPASLLVGRETRVAAAVESLRHTYPDGRLPYDGDLMNRAVDCIINSGLLADKVGAMPTRPDPKNPADPKRRVPLGCLHDLIDWNTDTNTAYAVLFEEQQRQPQPQPQPQDGGSGSGGFGRDVLTPGEAGDPHKGSGDPGADQPVSASAAAEALKASQPERQAALERGVNAARQAGQGSTNVESMVRAARAPAVDWQQYFQGWVARAVGTSAYDWRRPLRRDMLRDAYGMGEAFFSPNRGGHACSRIVIVVDTSGSIGPDEVRVAIATIADALEELNPKEGIAVVFCDTQIQRVDELVPGDDVSQIMVPQGGGTDFRPPFDLVRERWNNECDGLVYLTDLFGPAPAEPPPYPVLWVCTTNLKAKWGETVNIDVNQLVK